MGKDGGHQQVHTPLATIQAFSAYCKPTSAQVHGSKLNVESLILTILQFLIDWWNDYNITVFTLCGPSDHRRHRSVR